jgi:hypothetical protein
VCVRERERKREREREREMREMREFMIKINKCKKKEKKYFI